MGAPLREWLRAARRLGTNFAPAGAISPEAITFDGTHIWTANFQNSVTRFHPLTGTATTFALPAGATNPRAIAFDGTHVWTANFGSNSVTRLNVANPAGAGMRINVGLPAGAAGPAALAFDGTNMWTTNFTSHNLTRLAP